METQKKAGWPDYLNPRDFRTAALASEVAIDLDNACRDSGQDYNSIKYLALLMKIGKHNVEASQILYEAFQKFSDKPITNLDELTLKISLAAQEMSCVETLSQDRLTSLRDLCMEISKASRNYADYFRRGLAA